MMCRTEIGEIVGSNCDHYPYGQQLETTHAWSYVYANAKIDLYKGVASLLFQMWAGLA